MGKLDKNEKTIYQKTVLKWRIIMMKRRNLLCGLLVCAMTAALAGCSGQESTTAGETQEAETAAAAEEEQSDAAPEETGAENSGAEVKTVLVSNMMNPLSWVDGEGNLQGYEYEIIIAIDELLEEYTFDIQAVSEEVQDITMEAGEADMSAGGYYLTAERQEAYEVPEYPVGAAAMKLYVRAEDQDQITNLKDVVELGWSIVPVAPGGGIYKALVQWNEANGNILEEIPTQDSLTTAEKLTMVAEGQCDVFINPNNNDNLGIVQEMGLDIVEVDEPIKVDETVLIIKKGETEFCEAVNEALKELTENGTIAELSKKWYGYNLLDNLKYIEK